MREESEVKKYKATPRVKTEDVVERKVKIRELAFRGLEEYRKLYRMRYQDLWHKIITDWREMCFDSWTYRRFTVDYVTSEPDVVHSVCLFLSDYIYIKKVSEECGLKLSKFFPRMIDDWLARCGGNLDDFCEL